MMGYIVSKQRVQVANLNPQGGSFNFFSDASSKPAQEMGEIKCG